MKTFLGLCAVSSLLLFSCNNGAATKDSLIEDNIVNAVNQYTIQTNLIEQSGRVLNPRTIREDGSIVYIPIDDWTSGFFPGSMWLLHELTNDSKWQPLAEKYTEDLDSVKYLKWHHDIGFMIGCSYLNGYRLADKKEYKEVIIEAAHSFSSRFRPNAGVTQSWDADKGWQAERGWKCPVIIDNMMNLELLFEGTRLSGDSTFYQIAVKHADTTMKYAFRTDNSCYHVVDYDPETGEVRKKQTAQGYADESAWARGQAWALYGYTLCYRYTGDVKYLEQARKIYQFIFTHPNLPADLIPYWDYNAPNIPNEPRDVSAATCTASALYEMHTYLPKEGYKDTADKILKNLSTPAYRAKVGENGNFILMHSVGSIPHGAEIDVPLNYADYYFLEGLIRKRDLETK
ncbi:glycoside hydrolase family 88 protein [Bacteroides sp. 51]|uniref:glycoside hydrolase family 88 protein n=1 Tax=Bacteroides sp. 51 TaxID=2302938 RepID=UPI0013D6D440|nr:glycoside hydrolase family 88 protein [Bacteroides sp. 51]NDV82534.1 glucuronyl hydrolase [Bacteroides sp. 51]